MRDELDHRTVTHALIAALAAGQLRGAPRALALEDVSLAPLDAALALAARVGCKAPEAQALLAAAEVVRRLRAATVAGERSGGLVG